MTETRMRTERDTFGAVAVPAERLWGADAAFATVFAISTNPYRKR